MNKIPFINLLLTSFCIVLSSCTVQYETYNGFEKMIIYENKTDLYIDNEKPRMVSELREIEKNNIENIFPKGQKIIIKKIYRTYPDTSGVYVIIADVLQGRHKEEKIIVSSSLNSSIFKKVTEKDNKKEGLTRE